MNYRGTLLVLASLATSLGSASCGGPGRATNANLAKLANQADSNAASSNSEELGLLVNMPFETEDVVWKEDIEKKSLVAVMLLSPANAEKLVSEASQIRPPEQAAISTESWFPAELVAQSGMSGENVLKGQAYAANAFFQEPYTGGRVIRIENTNYFVLDLSRKPAA